MNGIVEKVDLKKTIDSYRARRGTFRHLTVPELRYLMIDGHGDPNTSPEYTDAVASLFPLAYAIKFASKKDLDRDYVVPPLEGLWWSDDLATFTTARDKSRWSWTSMILVPEWIDDALVARCIERVEAKSAPPRLSDVRIDALAEGECVQTLHVGSFDDEAPVLATLHDEFLPAQGLRPTGKHHEIYFSDPRSVAPAKQLTILRQPVARL